jgi:hypothetical protein
MPLALLNTVEEVAGSVAVSLAHVEDGSESAAVFALNGLAWRGLVKRALNYRGWLAVFS